MTVNVFVYAVMANCMDRDHIGHEVYVEAVHQWLPIIAIEHRHADVTLTAQCGPYDVRLSHQYDTTINIRVPQGPEPKDNP